MTTPGEAKFYRDKFVLEDHETLGNKVTWQAHEKREALELAGVSPENFDKIKGPEKKKPGAILTDKIAQAKQFCEDHPLYYDDADMWWLWNHERKCWEIIKNDVDLHNILYDKYGVNTVDAKVRNEIMQALKQVARMERPKDIPKTWIQFKDKIIDIMTGQEYVATPAYFTVNPIPYSLSKDKFFETEKMDKIFEEWVGKDNVKKLYEIIAYCLLPDYPIHRLFCFIGGGMNGKSCYMRLIEKFIGEYNCCSTELDTLLNSRFEVTRLHKKLVCIMGETNFNELSKTSILKKLTGQDLIGFEYKNKTPFSERNYAKILISTNNLPETTDKTIGFYRRWDIIDFPNKFSEQKDILQDIPEAEYEYLALKCTMILYDLLKERKFTNEGTIEDRQKVYEEKSNPFDKFYNEAIEEDATKDIPAWEFEKKLNEWCKSNRFREMSSTAIGIKMKQKNIQQARLSKEWHENNTGTKKQFRCWVGITWK